MKFQKSSKNIKTKNLNSKYASYLNREVFSSRNSKSTVTSLFTRNKKDKHKNK